jgi:hypothetical protein
MRPPTYGAVYADEAPFVPGKRVYRFTRLYGRLAVPWYYGEGQLNARLSAHKKASWYRPDLWLTWSAPYPADDDRQLRQDELRAIVVNQPKHNCERDRGHLCYLPPRPADDGGRVPTWKCDDRPGRIGCGVDWYFNGSKWVAHNDPRR